MIKLNGIRTMQLVEIMMTPLGYSYSRVWNRRGGGGNTRWGGGESAGWEVGILLKTN